MIESEEPPPLRVLDIICHNELCEAMGYDRCHFYKVGWLQSLAAPFFDLSPSSIKKEQVEVPPKEHANSAAQSPARDLKKCMRLGLTVWRTNAGKDRRGGTKEKESAFAVHLLSLSFLIWQPWTSG
jgi:hypothetical protein